MTRSPERERLEIWYQLEKIMEQQSVAKHIVPLEDLTLSELQTQHHALTSLSKFPEWVQYLEILSRQMAFRKDIIAHTPLKSMDDALGQEYIKGEISGTYQVAFLLPITFCSSNRAWAA